MTSNQENRETRKIRDGRMILGDYIQWLVDNHQELTSVEIRLLQIIARNTFGWRKRYGYIKSEALEMGMSKKTRNTHMKRLKEQGLLDYRRTRGYTMYKILVPEEIEARYEFVSGGQQQSGSEEPEEVYSAAW